MIFTHRTPFLQLCTYSPYHAPVLLFWSYRPHCTPILILWPYSLYGSRIRPMYFNNQGIPFWGYLSYIPSWDLQLLTRGNTGLLKFHSPIWWTLRRYRVVLVWHRDQTLCPPVTPSPFLEGIFLGHLGLTRRAFLEGWGGVCYPLPVG